MTDRTSAAFRHRSALKLLTMANHKTPKGEGAGYLTAILYLMPHTSGGGATLCPYSTGACRAMCLSGAGLSGLPRAMGAKQRRTDLLNIDQGEFEKLVYEDIHKLVRIAKREGLQPAVRLNGTSDILWERTGIPWAFMPGLVEDPVTFYDYTKIPLHLRKPTPNYRLTFSVGRESVDAAASYLLAGHSVAAVVPEWVKGDIAHNMKANLPQLHVADGDEHDLRFLDKPGTLVLLKPKGRIISDLLIPDIDTRLIKAMRALRAA